MPPSLWIAMIAASVGAGRIAFFVLDLLAGPSAAGRAEPDAQRDAESQPRGSVC